MKLLILSSTTPVKIMNDFKIRVARLNWIYSILGIVTIVGVYFRIRSSDIYLFVMMTVKG